MSSPDALRQHLDTLTTYLDIPGADLNAMLDVLIDDITTAVPSFLGLRLTVTAGAAGTTITTLHPDLARTTQASLLLPLHQITHAAPGDSLILYAAQPGAFTALATATRETFNLDGQIVLDPHLDTDADPLTPPVVSGADDPRLINNAIGVLIDHGYPTDHAHQELTRRARRHGTNLTTAAQKLLASL